MTTPQIEIVGILLITVVLFLWGRWRHDVVAIAALLACVLIGVVPADAAFAGFGHPAVVTVACVLILSRGLQDTGAVDTLTQRVLPKGLGPITGIGVLAGLGAVLSAFMNNVGAMALLLPVAVQLADRLNMAPSRILMPLAFGTILGGMTTLIGTPPNLIVSGFRAATGAGAFEMFAFTPVGLAVAVAGIAFTTVVGWRLVPARQKSSVDDFETGAYLAEARVNERSRAAGKTLAEAEALLDNSAEIVGLVHNNTRLHTPNRRRRLAVGDVLVLLAEPDDLASATATLGLTLGKPGAEAGEDDVDSGEQPSKPVTLQEYVVMPTSTLIGRSSGSVRMASEHGLNLLAVSREGHQSIRRLKTMLFNGGDLLLLQGPPEALGGFAGEYGLVPLSTRDIRLPEPGKAVTASAIMALAIAMAAFGLLSAPVAFALGVLGMSLTRIIAPRNLYRAVDWPVIILLAALIPVAGAMATTGAADLLADALLNRLAQGSPVIAMALLLIVTMTLSDFMNNAATAAVMCPIALSGAVQLGVNADPLLMAVAIGASCAFLTPIGHQNNTLILGPGGLHFGDYWRLGLPMELLVVAVSIPMLLWIWPL